MPLKVTIAVPNRDDFKAEMVASLMRMVTMTGAQVTLSMPQTCYIDDARNQCFEDARTFGSDWLLFMDTDNSFDNAGNVFRSMLSLGKDVVSGIYVQRLRPYRPLVYDFTPDGLIKNITEIPTAPFRRDATGCGLLLISKKVIDAFTPEVIARLGRPFDFLNYGKPNMLREDPAFCWRIKELGFELWFDPSIKMGHHGKEKFTLEHYEACKKMVATQDKSADGEPDGWMTPEELKFLAESARNMESIVEIGSWKGRSTKTLLSYCPGTVTAVDHWQGSPEIKHLVEGNDIEAVFDRNVGHYPNLRKIKKPSVEAAAGLNGDRFDMVFIDASHDYLNVKADIEAWLPRAKRLICGHDYENGCPGVIQAVKERFGDRVKTVDTIWYVELEETR